MTESLFSESSQSSRRQRYFETSALPRGVGFFLEARENACVVQALVLFAFRNADGAGGAVHFRARNGFKELRKLSRFRSVDRDARAAVIAIARTVLRINAVIVGTAALVNCEFGRRKRSRRVGWKRNS